MNPRTIPILLAEDNDDHAELITDALKEHNVLNTIYRAKDGQEALDYLYHKDQFANESEFPRPQLILLDLRMPRKDGMEVLKTVKEDANLKSIPVVILTTSKKEEEVVKGYHLGANSYLTKPIDFVEFVDKLKALNVYWILTSELPPQ